MSNTIEKTKQLKEILEYLKEIGLDKNFLIVEVLNDKFFIRDNMQHLFDNYYIITFEDKIAEYQIDKKYSLVGNHIYYENSILGNLADFLKYIIIYKINEYFCDDFDCYGGYSLATGKYYFFQGHNIHEIKIGDIIDLDELNIDEEEYKKLTERYGDTKITITTNNIRELIELLHYYWRGK